MTRYWLFRLFWNLRNAIIFCSVGNLPLHSAVLAIHIFDCCGTQTWVGLQACAYVPIRCFPEFQSSRCFLDSLHTPSSCLSRGYRLYFQLTLALVKCELLILLCTKQQSFLRQNLTVSPGRPQACASSASASSGLALCSALIPGSTEQLDVHFASISFS